MGIAGIALLVIGVLVFIAGIALFIRGILKKSGREVVGAVVVYVIGFIMAAAGFIMWTHDRADDSVGMIPDIIKLGMSLNT